MSPIFVEAAGAILRSVLQIGAGYIVARGIWTQGQSETYVAAAAISLLTLGWSLWNKYKGRIKFLAALASPTGTTEQDVHEIVADKTIRPSVTQTIGTPEQAVAVAAQIQKTA